MARTRFGAAPSDDLRERIRMQVAETAAPAGRMRNRLIGALAAVPVLTAIVVAIASEIVYRRPAVGLETQSTRLTWTLFALVLMTLAATALAIRRGSRGFGTAVTPLTLAPAAVILMYAVLTVLNPIHLHDAAVSGVQISPWGVRCALIAAIVGVGAMVAFTAALHRAVPVASRLRGAVLGAAAGAWAGLAVFAFCPSGDHQHLLAGHLLPIIALTLVGAAATPRLLRP
jgi:hypothetical protein